MTPIVAIDASVCLVATLQSMSSFFKRFFPVKPKAEVATAEADFELARAAHLAGDLVKAADLYLQLAEADPGRADAFYKLGNVYRDQQRPLEALRNYERATSLSPTYAQAFCNRGVILHQIERPMDALESLATAISLDPKDSIAHYNTALVLQACGRREDALLSYNRAIELNASFSDAQYNRALLLLSLGDLNAGWRAYEWRWKVADRIRIGQQPEFDEPLWLGEPSLTGRKLLLWSEGGLGDTLQFSRYAALCAKRGAHVILQVQPPLAFLLRSTPGVQEIALAGARPPPFNLHCPLMSLPLAFETTLDCVPMAAGYLSADENRILAWRARLGPATAPRIGLAWSGNPHNWIDQHRSIALSKLLLMLPPQFEYFSLQTEVRASDSAALSQSRIRTFPAAELTFENTAALCRTLDLVVTVDTSLAHLAGSLGHPTWLLLPENPDWRWGYRGRSTPWYSSMRLYRQASGHSWSETLSQVARDLVAYFSPPSN